MTLTRQQVIDLNRALKAFDGTPSSPTKLTMQTRYALAKNLRITKGIVRDIEKARDALIRSIAEGGFIPQGSPLADVFDRQWAEFAEGTEEVSLMRFKLSDFNLDVNSIPVTALADMGPVIIEEDEK